MSLDSGALVEVADGKSTEVLVPFWKRLKHSQAKIEAVETNMGLVYIEAVRESLPEAVLVFDHFHIIKLYNEKMPNLRREIAREADVLEKKFIEGTCWVLMKTAFRLVVEKDEHT